MPLPGYIEPVEKWGVRTFLSAALANAAIAVLNAVLGMRGSNGIKVHIAEAGIVVELAPDYKKKLDTAIEGGGGGGSINFRGVWSDSETYDTDDVVIRSSATDMVDQKSATFICIADGTTGAGNAPPAGETMDTAKWKTLARGHWKKFVTADTADATLGTITLEAGKMTINLDNASPSPTRLIIEKADIPGWAVGSQMRIREERVCIAVVEKKCIGIFSDPVAV